MPYSVLPSAVLSRNEPLDDKTFSDPISLRIDSVPKHGQPKRMAGFSHPVRCGSGTTAVDRQRLSVTGVFSARENEKKREHEGAFGSSTVRRLLLPTFYPPVPAGNVP